MEYVDEYNANDPDFNPNIEPVETPKHPFVESVDAEVRLEIENAELLQRAEAAEAELARVKEALQAAFDYLPDDYYGPDPDGGDRLNALNRKIKAALRPGGEKE